MIAILLNKDILRKHEMKEYVQKKKTIIYIPTISLILI